MEPDPVEWGKLLQQVEGLVRSVELAVAEMRQSTEVTRESCVATTACNHRHTAVDIAAGNLTRRVTLVEDGIRANQAGSWQVKGSWIVAVAAVLAALITALVSLAK